MPQHRRLHTKKFLDSVSESLIKEYFDRFFQGRHQFGAYDPDSVFSFIEAPENDTLKIAIEKDFERINDICEQVMNHLIDAAHAHQVEIRDESRENLAMRVFLFHPGAFEYAYDKFCIFNAENKVSEHNVSVDAFIITPEKIDAFKSRISGYYAGLAKGQECIVRHYIEEGKIYILVSHGSYRRSVPTWEGYEIKTLFYRPAIEDVLIYDKRAGTLSIKAPHKGDKENYIKAFTEVIVEDGHQARRPDRDRTYTLEPLRNGTFSFAGNEEIAGITLVEVKISLPGPANSVVAIKSRDVIKSLDDDLHGKVALKDGPLLDAKFRFNLRVDGRRRNVSFMIAPPNVTNLHRKKYADVIGAYLKENGVKLV